MYPYKVKLFVAVIVIPLLCLLQGCAQKKAKAETSPDTENNEMNLPYYKSADFEPIWLGNSEEAKSTINHRLPHFSFLNQFGQMVSENNVQGKIHVANFFFTTCGSICPAMTGEFQKIQSIFKNNANVLLLSFSVDPKRDTVGALMEYAQLHGAIKNKWHFLTGKKQELYALGRNFYFAEKTDGLGKNAEDFLHTENFILIDQLGFIRGVYTGTLPQETERLVHDIAKLETEKSSEAGLPH